MSKYSKTWGLHQLFSGFELADRNCEYCIWFLLLLYLFSVLISRVKSISTDFYSLFYCCFVTPLSQVRGRVKRSLTGLTPPHTLCACPKPGTCNPVLSLFNCLLLFVFHCFNRVGRLLYFMNCDTFCIFRGLVQLALRCGFRSIVEGRNVTCISLNLSVCSGWLSHGQSCHIFLSLFSSILLDSNMILSAYNSTFSISWVYLGFIDFSDEVFNIQIK